MRRLIALLGILLITDTCWAVKPVQMVTRSITSGQNGVAYSFTLRGKFGTKPYTWTKPSGTLPTGLSLAGATGIISGTPSANGTFNFTITVTDSAGSPTSDTRNFSMTVAGSAPVTPVSIITTSLPSGSNGVAYSAAVQAANGTAPYTWSIPSGFLPPGLALNTSTGAVTGTPTVSGSYSPTFKVTDANSGTSSRAYALVIATGSPTYLFSDNFESNNMAAWDDSYGYATQGTVKRAGSYAAGAHYVICGDSSNPACGASHQDSNLQFEKTYDTAALTDVYFRGYFYHKTPESGGSPYHGDKLFYFTAGCFSCSRYPTGDPWSIGFAVNRLSPDIWPGAGPLKLSWFLQSTNVGGSSYSIDCGTSGNPITGTACALQYDTWYSLEVQIKYNTAASAPFNGEVKIWIDGTSVYTATAVGLNRASSEKLKLFRVGAQSDRDLYRAIDEYRYWDDLVLNSSYIGP